MKPHFANRRSSSACFLISVTMLLTMPRLKVMRSYEHCAEIRVIVAKVANFSDPWPRARCRSSSSCARMPVHSACFASERRLSESSDGENHLYVGVNTVAEMAIARRGDVATHSGRRGKRISGLLRVKAMALKAAARSWT